MHDQLLIRAFNAYRRGLRQMGAGPSPMGSRDFDALIFLGSLGRIPLRERWRLGQLRRSCSRALVAARKGELAEAEGHYAAAKENLPPLAGARLAWLLGTSSYEAGYAYLDFRRHQVEAARRRLDRAMDADLELEREGIPVLQIHRIQQGHNLARMDFRLDRRGTAIELSGLLVAYLEGRIASLPYHHDWRPGALGTRELLQSMIRQVLAEAAERIATGGRPAEEWRQLIEAARLEADPAKALLPQAQYALRAQSALLREDFGSYLENLEHFFLAGIRHVHTLWYALMDGFLHFCLATGSQLSRQAAATILSDAKQWKVVPPALQPLFRSSPASTLVA